MFKIPKNIEFVLKTLNKNGFKAFIVGGCVRDMLLGKTPNDFDITTSALPTDIEHLFVKTIPTGIKHGTVTVIIDNSPIEITTFRCDGIYNDNRHPEKIEFVSDIRDDLARRDFTVNALAYNESEGLVDYYNGQNDLENKILKAVGKPKKRFEEDALRILRLFRFSSVLDFDIEESTLFAALDKGYLLKNISVERIFPEIFKTVSGVHSEVLSTLIEKGHLDFLDITNVPDFEKIKTLKNNQSLAFFSFLFYSSKNVMQTVKKLKVSNETKNYFETFLNIIDTPIPTSKADIKRMLCIASPEIIIDYFTFKSVFSGCEIENSKKLLTETIKNNEPYLISHLEINGDFLKSKGYNGLQIGKILKELQQRVIDSPETNTKEKLNEIIKEISP